MRRLSPSALSLAAALALVACAAPEADPPGQPATGTATQDIRNGTRDPRVVPLSPGQVLAVGWLHTRGDPESLFCSGTIIAPNVAVTAQHCTFGEDARDISFAIGLLPTDPVATFAVADIYEHDDEDISVLFLAEDAVARVPELVPIRANLDPLTDAIIGQEVEAAGYGETYDRTRSGRYFAVVQAIELDGVEIVVDGRQMQGICYGDSGGPVLSVIDGEPRVLGVESYGDESCFGIDHLTRTDWVADWLAPLSGGVAPPDMCEGIDYRGRCVGSVAQWCDSGHLEERDCNLQGKRCAFVDDETGFFCVDGGDCGELGATGVCEGDSVVRCRFGERVYNDCAARDRVCRTDNSGAFCADPNEAPPPDAGVEPDAIVEGDMGSLADAAVEVPPDVVDGAIAVRDGDVDPKETTGKGNDGCSSTGPGPFGLASLLGLLPLLKRRRRRR